MDISFPLGEQIFNYRVAGLFIRDNQLLVMKDEKSPYYFLPGGRVKIGEKAEDAMLREVEEELGVKADIDRPLWLVQKFFIEEVSQQPYHEICLYFLMKLPADADFLSHNTFLSQEGERLHQFSWISFEELQSAYFYPEFLKEKIVDLPEHLTLLTAE